MLKILGMDCGSVLLIWTVYLQSTTVTWICTADLHCDIMWHILSMCKLFVASFVMFNSLLLSFYILFLHASVVYVYCVVSRCAVDLDCGAVTVGMYL